jgi:hypothetical protein
MTTSTFLSMTYPVLQCASSFFYRNPAVAGASLNWTHRKYLTKHCSSFPEIAFQGSRVTDHKTPNQNFPAALYHPAVLCLPRSILPQGPSEIHTSSEYRIDQ